MGALLAALVAHGPRRLDLRPRRGICAPEVADARASAAGGWRSLRVGLLVGLSRAGAGAPARRGGGVGALVAGASWPSSRQAGRPVFVDFTAAWCLTCQVNERVALRDPEVQARLRDEGSRLPEGRLDALRRPQITEALASHGRQGVPLYVLYGARPRAAVVLPEVLTPGIVLEALDGTSSGRTGRSYRKEERR